MKYRLFLRLKIQEGTWTTLGENHIIPWDFRDLVAASSGWFIINQESLGLASTLAPKLQKGIVELTKSSQTYADYEAMHGLGTIEDVLHFYQDLLKDCQHYPFTEICGCVVA